MRRSDGWWAAILVAMLGAGAAVAQGPRSHAMAERSGSWERRIATTATEEVTTELEPEPTSSSTMPGRRRPLRPLNDAGASASLLEVDDRDPVWGYWYERHNLVRQIGRASCRERVL